MEIAFGIVCVVFFLIVVLGPLLRRWIAPLFQRWAMGKMEDQMRRMAGMPTRKEEKKARKQRERMQREGAERFRRAAAGSRSGARYGSRSTSHSTIGMLRYVAEDVEFTEVKEFGSDPTPGGAHEVRYKVEEQVEDADFVEIKEK